MAGLIKTILVLAHGEAPPNLHASDVNPRINLASLPAVLPSPGTLTRLSQPPSDSSAPIGSRGIELGEGEGGLRESKEQPRGGIACEGVVEGKMLESKRAPVESGSAEPEVASPNDLEDRESSGMIPGHREISLGSPFYGGVSSFGFGGTNTHVILAGKAGAFDGRGSQEPIPGLAFLFTGQGSQYPGMGRDLYESLEAFRAVIDECDQALVGTLPRRLVSVLYEDEEAGESCRLLP